MIKFDAVDFSERRSEEVSFDAQCISYLWLLHGETNLWIAMLLQKLTLNYEVCQWTSKLNHNL